MKRVIILLAAFGIAAALAGILFFRPVKGDKKEGLVLEQYFTVSGIRAKAYGNYLVVYDGDLKIFELNSKTLLKTLDIPAKTVLGFDIYEDKLVWSDLRNEPDPQKLKADNGSTNSDIFLYDIKKDSMEQITTQGSAQINPVIWGNYIAWQDNRDDDFMDDNPKWNIYLYDIEKKSEKRITTAEGVHTNCRLSNNRLVWEDGRHASLIQGMRYNYGLPSNNTDIYMYIIDEDRYQPVAYERYQEARPDINGNYIVWEDRNNFMHNADIMLYDINTLKVKNLTGDEYNQIKPVINGDIAAWVDERRGTETFEGVQQKKTGNSDIGVYDLKTGEKSVIEEEGIQTDCSVTPSYIVYASKTDEKSSAIKVVKYTRTLK